MFNVLRMVVLFSITELNQFTCPQSGNIYLHGSLSFFFFLNKLPNKCEEVSYCSFNSCLHRPVAFLYLKYYVCMYYVCMYACIFTEVSSACCFFSC